MILKLTRKILCKYRLILLLSIALNICNSKISYAELSLPFDPADPEAGPYMTKYGEKEEKSVFTLDETPYVFFQFKKTDLEVPPEVAEIIGLGENWLDFYSDWEYENGTEFYWLQDEKNGIEDSTNPDLVNFWFTLNTWEVNKQIGSWSVHGIWMNPDTIPFPVVGEGQWNFTVTPTPEPISSLLFISGSTMLLFFKRKNKQSKNKHTRT